MRSGVYAGPCAWGPCTHAYLQPREYKRGRHVWSGVERVAPREGKYRQPSKDGEYVHHVGERGEEGDQRL